MILRRNSPTTSTFPFILLLLLFSPSLAQDEAVFDCKPSVNNLNFDLTTLSGEHSVSRTRETQPSTMIDMLRFDLCAELKPQDGVAERDQCPHGTRACLTTTNKKSDESDRVVAVVPIAQTSTLKPTFDNLSSPKGLSLVFHGPEIPHPITSTPIAQSLNITLLCDPSGISDPTFISYNDSVFQLEWKAPAGCGFGTDQPPSGGGDEKQEDPNPEGEKLLLLAFAAYLGLGAYYNYSTYGARGSDLIPSLHACDVLSHLCSNASPRRSSSRGGYISV
ncbi:autophagy-related protein 27 [Infundibulicybe gibba]|nr:autophagy-related protein 27 [Infundibulicybe gibba]